MIKKLLKMKSFRTDEVIRYSGIHSVKPESLSHHIIEVQLVALLIAAELEIENILVNKETLLLKSLLHDMDEVITGDFPRPVKYWSESIRSQIEAVSTETVKTLSDKEFGSDEIFNIWMDSKKGPEGMIVKVADLLVVAKKSLEETLIFSNKTYLKVLKEVIDYLSNLDLDSSSPVEYHLAGIVDDSIVELQEELGKMMTSTSFNSIIDIVSYDDYFTK